MRLSNPRTVQSNINDQRKADIDNGLKLARKVDDLRETVLKEEQKLENHRNVIIPEVQRQIDLKIEERDELERELVPIRKKREELLKPLDEEWLKVNQTKSDLEKEKTDIENEKQKTLLLVKKAEQNLKLSKLEQERSFEKGKVANQESKEAHDKLLEAQKCLSDARNEEKRINSLLDKRKLEIKEEEEVLKATVLSISIREKEIEADKKFIEEEKIRLQDMRGTLERALARTNK